MLLVTNATLFRHLFCYFHYTLSVTTKSTRSINTRVLEKDSKNACLIFRRQLNPDHIREVQGQGTHRWSLSPHFSVTCSITFATLFLSPLNRHVLSTTKFQWKIARTLWSNPLQPVKTNVRRVGYIIHSSLCLCG